MAHHESLPVPVAAVEPAHLLRRWGKVAARWPVDAWIATALLAAMVLLPLAAVAARGLLALPLSGAIVWTQALNLLLAFFGAWIAARERRHLALSTGELLASHPRLQRAALLYGAATALVVSLFLVWAACALVQSERGAGSTLPGGVPVWVVQLAMPLALFATLPEFLRVPGSTPAQRATLLGIGVAITAGAVVLHGSAADMGAWPWLLALLLAMALGAPLYIVLGGLALVLLAAAGVPLAAIPTETYTLVASPTLPSLPLFTLAGCLLAEGGASRRLVALFDACFGWMPGGIACAAILVCAFFTTFTGASGVTILALGGLLLPALVAAGYPKRYAIGLLTASGSIGLLFPPSLPVILYGVVAHVPIDRLFLAAWKPGLLLVGLLFGSALLAGRRAGVRRGAFSWPRCRTALLAARYELLLPLIVLWGFFGGHLTILETAAAATAWAFLSEVVLHRDLALASDIPRVFRQCATLMGGVLVILGMAMGLTNYLIDAQLPEQITAWVGGSIASRLVFIAFLNLFLLAVGCLMDIYSAIMVVVPLIVPISLAFGIDPLHLGVLFLANMELGYLTPPVGMNLFLAAYRFELPLATVYRLSLPFCVLLLAGVLLISWCPGLTRSGAAATQPAAVTPARAMDIEALLEQEP